MKIIETAIEGVVIIEPRLFKDERGYFFESFSQREFEEKIRKISFVQDNESKSSYGVFRNHHTHKASLFVSLKVLYLMLPLISAKALPLLENMLQ